MTILQRIIEQGRRGFQSQLPDDEIHSWRGEIAFMGLGGTIAALMIWGMI